MTKFFKGTGFGGVVAFQPEGTNMFIPVDEGNTDYANMMREVAAGESTIEEVDDTP